MAGRSRLLVLILLAGGPPTIYGAAFVALGCWATFTTSKTLTSRGGWSRHRTLVVAGILFVASCFLPGTALLAGAFRGWMLIPLGLSYIVLIPLPCYFGWANRGRVRTARAILFLLVGTGLLIVGLGRLPLSWLGL